MIFSKRLSLNLKVVLFSFFSILLVTSCSDDEPMMVVLESDTFNYELHNGQAVPSAPYGGFHPTDFSASMKLDEMENGNTMISVTLTNAIIGATYHMHAHDAADAATTPNGTPYNESPNADVFVQMIEAGSSSVTVTQESTMSYDELTNNYSGFFVVHDPLQSISTTDISTYLVVGGFARAQAATNLSSLTFSYDFNTGQVAETFAYSGDHSNTLAATIQVDELMDSKSRVTVRIMNTMDGETYHTHAHDMADPATTENGTPYIEAPNGGVFAAPIMGNGDMVGQTNVSDMSFTEITSTYDGFFVIHDPLQAITTTDPTTYIVLGVFAR